jgi:hypothetical protein
MPGIVEIVSGLLKPAADIIDELHTSEDEKLAAKQKLLVVQTQGVSAVLDYERSVAAEQGQTIREEAKGESWIQRSWRPLIMLMFGSIIGFNYLVVPIAGMFSTRIVVLTLPPDLWDLLKLGIGGYIGGRTAEKIVPSIMEAFKTKEKT